MAGLPAVADLVTHVARFGAALRDRAVAVGLNDEADALEALTLVDVGDRDEVHRTLRVAFKVRPRDVEAFDELFGRMWGSRAGGDSQVRPSLNPPVEDPTKPPRPPRVQRAVALPPADARQPSDSDAEHEVPVGDDPGFSRDAALRRKPFDEWTSIDLQEMGRLVAQLARQLATRPSRRRVPARGHGDIDLRRSFRHAVAQGGEFLSLARRARAIEAPRLVVLCDTSGSMDPHTRFLLGFVLALRRVARRSEVFVFNTALVRLTSWLSAGQALRPEFVERTLRRLAAGVPDWSGGTRIGECFATFVDSFLDQVVDRRTVVVILSDGLDSGDSAPLAGAMRAIQRRALAVVWLNPLAGDRRYQPTARAMAAALPYINHLLPAHNLESLRRLLPLLAA
jgi:uncharacterized protein